MPWFFSKRTAHAYSNLNHYKNLNFYCLIKNVPSLVVLISGSGDTFPTLVAPGSDPFELTPHWNSFFFD